MASPKEKGLGGDSHDRLYRRWHENPNGAIMRNYLRFVRLTHTQCVSNVFRILGCVSALNEKIGLQLTHHDVNWVYGLHHLKGKG